MWEFPQKRLVKRGIMYQKYIKRGLDFILSLVASIILSPVSYTHLTLPTNSRV